MQSSEEQPRISVYTRETHGNDCTQPQISNLLFSMLLLMWQVRQTGLRKVTHLTVVSQNLISVTQVALSKNFKRKLRLKEIPFRRKRLQLQINSKTIDPHQITNITDLINSTNIKSA